VANVREAWRVYTLTDHAEYVALTGLDTKAYDNMLSCGLVDLALGSRAQILLWAMFPEGTTTGDNFRDETKGLVVPPPAPTP